MDITLGSQILTGLISAGAGVGLCLIYDVFRVIRLGSRPSFLAVLLQDLCYWLIAAVVLFCLLTVRCGGEMRGYVFLGAVIGFVLCRITISQWIMAAANAVLHRFRIVWRWLKGHIYRPAAARLRVWMTAADRAGRAGFARISREFDRKKKKFLENRKKDLQNEDDMEYNQNTTD